jgi:hypothetical protein
MPSIALAFTTSLLLTLIVGAWLLPFALLLVNLIAQNEAMLTPFGTRVFSMLKTFAVLIYSTSPTSWSRGNENP